jgi:hypothetical protein
VKIAAISLPDAIFVRKAAPTFSFSAPVMMKMMIKSVIPGTLNLKP